MRVTDDFRVSLHPCKHINFGNTTVSPYKSTKSGYRLLPSNGRFTSLWFSLLPPVLDQVSPYYTSGCSSHFPLLRLVPSTLSQMLFSRCSYPDICRSLCPLFGFDGRPYHRADQMKHCRTQRLSWAGLACLEGRRGMQNGDLKRSAI